MRPDDLHDWLKAPAFRPFRITLNSGRTYEVRHPEMVKVGRTTVYIFHYPKDQPDTHERVDHVSLLLIERIEPIDAPAKKGA